MDSPFKVETMACTYSPKAPYTFIKAGSKNTVDVTDY
jgi:hypothetical protein